MFLRKWFDLCSTTLLGAALAAGCTTEADPQDEAVATTVAPLLASDASKIVPDQYVIMFKSDIGARAWSRPWRGSR